MISITLNGFANIYVEENKGEQLDKFKDRLKKSVKHKKAGAACINCGSPIWAIGSTIVEWSGCFTCISGDTDSSEDYEIDVVNF